MNRLRCRLRRDGDAGFGLIEMVVALLIAGMVFSALATTLIASVRTSLLSRQNQQAADFMTQAIEDMRLLSYGSLSVDGGLLSGGPASLATCSGGAEGAALDGPGSCYPLVQPAGGTAAGVTAVSTLAGDNGSGNADTNNTTYTLYRYVTEVPGQGASAVRRVTVYASWQLNGTTHTRSSSTVISYSQRGLPLPYFTLKGNSGVCVNPLSRAVLEFTLENKGAPDRWNLTLSGSTTGFRLYADADGTTLLQDTSGDGTVDTGRVDPASVFRFFLILPGSATATMSGTYTTTVTATSVAQPTATSAAQSVSVATVVQAGTCSGPAPTPTPTTTPTPTPTPTPTGPALVPDTICSLSPEPSDPVGTGGYTTHGFWLLNGGSPTPAQSQLVMSSTASSTGALGAYSTDIDPNLPGRVLTQSSASTYGAVESLASASQFADWVMPFGKVKLNVNSGTNTGRLALWVANRAQGTAVPAATLRVAVWAVVNNAATQMVYVNVPISGACTGMQEVSVPLNVAWSGYSGAKTVDIHVRVAVSGADVRLGYDAPGMAAKLVLETS